MTVYSSSGNTGRCTGLVDETACVAIVDTSRIQKEIKKGTTGSPAVNKQAQVGVYDSRQLSRAV